MGKRRISVHCGITLKVPVPGRPGEDAYIKPLVSFEDDLGDGEDILTAYERLSRQVGMLFCLEAKKAAKMAGYLGEHACAEAACDQYFEMLKSLPTGMEEKQSIGG